MDGQERQGSWATLPQTKYRNLVIPTLFPRAPYSCGNPPQPETPSHVREAHKPRIGTKSALLERVHVRKDSQMGSTFIECCDEKYCKDSCDPSDFSKFCNASVLDIGSRATVVEDDRISCNDQHTDAHKIRENIDKDASIRIFLDSRHQAPVSTSCDSTVRGIPPCPSSRSHLQDFTCEPASQWKAMNTTLAGGSQRPGATLTSRCD